MKAEDLDKLSHEEKAAYFAKQFPRMVDDCIERLEIVPLSAIVLCHLLREERGEEFYRVKINFERFRQAYGKVGGAIEEVMQDFNSEKKEKE